MEIIQFDVSVPKLLFHAAKVWTFATGYTVGSCDLRVA